MIGRWSCRCWAGSICRPGRGTAGGDAYRTRAARCGGSHTGWKFMSMPLPRSSRAEVRSGSDPMSKREVGETGPLPNTAGRCAVEVCACPGRASKLAWSGAKGRGPGGPGFAAPWSPPRSPSAGAGFLFELQGFCGAREKPGGGGTWAQLRQALWLMRETEAGGRPERRCRGCRGLGDPPAQ